METDKPALVRLTAKLEVLARKTIHDCTFEKTVQYIGADSRMRLLLPSGDEKYGSFWVRDAAMMAESGLVDDDELKSYIEIIACHGQNGAEVRRLANGLTVPPYAVADHVNYDGGAVFFPGTYSSGEDQGNGTFGFFPPFCDNYFFILAVRAYWLQSGDASVLENEYSGIPLLDRLEAAFDGYGIDPRSGLCVSRDDAYTVDWGFADTVRKTGKLLMPSLLRRNAALALADLCKAAQKADKGAHYRTEAKKIEESILKTFGQNESGWLDSATGIGRQPDVFATAYAVYSGLKVEEKTWKALYLGYTEGTAAANGYVRHIPTDRDFSPASAWESASSPHNEYQNGAYWATATGWYAYALYKYNTGFGLLTDFLRHTEKHADRGAPFEWIDRETETFSGLHYGTSGVLPYIGARRILEEARRKSEPTQQL